ncbi:metal-dependent hydrolase [Halorubrum sp. JWXQ-INN 858]|uniref:metal-dependent hydrolase n=1 Tax=Halorubrum sp. JWXQ-INN 858 TaxID=2690782 RepID=UPI0013584A34|nr:metal-dependent hydrolase [Halorubrum sp. JWXQ-INN 858]MWV65204.1 metal-dependent hydrolase [Halorubrum sp. JWXQ-INN 858]
MYWRGHVGLGLLAYAPIAGIALDAGEPRLAALGGLLAVAFATLPDADERLPIPHRGPTHTLLFAFVTGALAALVAALVGALVVPTTPAWTPTFVGTVVTITLLSHIAGDAITPMGIRPFRPVSDAHFTLDLTPAKNPRANYLFLVVGVLALTASVLRVA